MAVGDPILEGVNFEIVTNPKAMAQAIAMTATVSGSNGIQVADNDNIDFGTDNFTLVWRGSLPDWTPSSTQALVLKTDSATVGYSLSIYVDGYVRFRVGSNAYNSSIINTLVDRTTHEIVVTVDQTTSYAIFYLDGIPFSNPVAFTPASVSSDLALYILGASTIRVEGVCLFSAIFNRALTAAEVLALYRNGIDFADKWGSQTELMPNQVDRDFSGASAWADVDLAAGGGAYNETTDLTITAGAAGAGDYCTCPVLSVPTTISYRYRLKLDVANLVGTWTIKSFDGSQTIGTVSATGLQQPFEWVATTTGGLRLVAVSNLASGDFDNFTLTKLGATFAFESEGIQPAPGQCLDSSSNKNHAMQPATGSSLVRFKKDFEFRWTNTWTASSAAQYIGGLNQVVLTTKHFITSIVSRATVVTDVENIEIGDGSAVAYYVAAVAPTAAPIIHTLAKNLNDGTNLKLVVTPAASATMTVEFIVKGYLLE